MTKKERGLLKGAIRRVFSRSDLRKEVLLASKIEHVDANRPRVKKWSKCAGCGLPTPMYLIQIDHKVPIVPVDRTLEDMSWDEVVSRVWCQRENLQALCEECHKAKTKSEREERKFYKKARGSSNGKTSKFKRIKKAIKRSRKRGPNRRSNRSRFS